MLKVQKSAQDMQCIPELNGLTILGPVCVPCGCFHKLGVHVLGVPLIRALLCGVYVKADDF